MKSLLLSILFFCAVLVLFSQERTTRKMSDLTPELDSLLTNYKRSADITREERAYYDSICSMVRHSVYQDSKQQKAGKAQKANGTTDFNNRLFDVPAYIPKTPEAAGISLYGNIPVGEYTGTPDISIPIYTMKCGSIELPITLSYHASGIKVAQEATWVGLGWNLIAGGSISLNAVGHADARSSLLPYWSNWQRIVNQWNLPSGANPTDPREGIEDGFLFWSGYFGPDPYTYLTTPDVVAMGLYGQGERDIYEVSLPNGKSFAYVLHPYDNSPMMIGQNKNCKISISPDYVTITDDDGTMYRFNEGTTLLPAVLTYNLSSITSKEGHTINFTYVRANQHRIPVISDTYVINPPPVVFSDRKNVGEDPGFTYYLSRIESDIERVDFSLSTRDDIAPSSSRKLDEILIKNKLADTIVYKYVFGYNYFVGTKVGGDYASADDGGYGLTAITENIRKKRLKLTTLTKTGTSNGASEKHAFTYYEDNPLPYKTSFATDFWGYYNGAENASNLMPPHKHTFIPNLEEMRINSAFLSHYEGELPTAGAIRNPSTVYMKAGTLKTIKYPTGGIVEFDFEPHTHNNCKIISKESYDAANQLSYEYTVNNNGSIMTPSVVFKIPFPQQVTLEASVRFDDYTAAQVAGSGTIIRSIGATGGGIVKELKITSADYGITSFHKTETFALDTGTYVMASTLVGVPVGQGISTRNISSGSIVYRVNQIDRDTLPSIGGGLRVKNIIKKDKSGNTQETTSYMYEISNGSSSGKLLFPLTMMSRQDIVYNPSIPGIYCDHTRYYYTTYRIHSQAVPLHPANIGANVGYSRVLKTITSSGSSNGKVISEYANTEPVKFSSHYTYFPPNNNSSLVKRQILDMAGTKVKEEICSYSINGEQREMINIYAVDNWIGPTGTCHPQLDGFNVLVYNGRFTITLYPSSNYWVDLTQRTEKSYYGSTAVTNTESFSYNNTHQVSQIQRTSSDSALPVTEQFTYPSDNTGYPNMRSYNVISPIVTHARTLDGKTITLTNTYSDSPSQKFTLQSTRENTPSGSYRTADYKYDSKWNPVEITFQNGISEVYLWGYNYSYVIAHIKNTTYATVTSRMGTTDLNTLCSASSPSATLLTKLRTQFPECEVTTWLYKPLVGVAQQTDPREVNTYYEYDQHGRLYRIKDHDGKILQQLDYNYAQ